LTLFLANFGSVINISLPHPGPDLPTGCVGLNLGRHDPRGFQETVVRIESISGI